MTPIEFDPATCGVPSWVLQSAASDRYTFVFALPTSMKDMITIYVRHDHALGIIADMWKQGELCKSFQ